MTPFVVALPTAGHRCLRPVRETPAEIPNPFRRASLTAGRALEARLPGVQQMRNSPPADCLAYLLSSSAV